MLQYKVRNCKPELIYIQYINKEGQVHPLGWEWRGQNQKGFRGIGAHQVVPDGQQQPLTPKEDLLCAGPVLAFDVHHPHNHSEVGTRLLQVWSPNSNTLGAKRFRIHDVQKCNTMCTLYITYSSSQQFFGQVPYNQMQ